MEEAGNAPGRFYASRAHATSASQGRSNPPAQKGSASASDLARIAPARAIRAGLGIIERVQRFSLTVRAGVHTGEAEIVEDDLRGITVHIGSRVASQAGESELLVSSTVKDLVVGSGFTFADRGSHEFKGVPGRWQLYAVEA